METVATVHCPQCGNDNLARFRFCGMCGTPLREVRDSQPKAQGPAAYDAAPLTVSAYSILGLDDQVQPEPLTHPFGDDTPRRRADYLLEDDEPRSRWGSYLALLLLAITAGTLGWQWRSGGLDLVLSRVANLTTTRTQSVPANPEPNPPANPEVPSPQAVAPASPAPSPISTPVQNLPAQSPAAVDAPTAASATPSSEPANTDQRNPDQTAPESTASTEPAAQPEPAPPNPAPDGSAAKATASDESTAAPPVASPALAASPADDAKRLLGEGESYLYGSGVTQDCNRAQQDIRAAARSSAEAESLLGSMYASGHCVGRDLPTAYRWFARSLRNDPANTRLQSDLEVLWKQMTPAERQAALHSAH